MQITQRKTATLKPYDKNARTHSAEQIKQLAASIKEFGFTVPILIDGTGEIIAGHGRLMAANKLGLKEVPCIEIKHLTEAQRRAYIIADNKLALNAGWDDATLCQELEWLKGEAFALDLTGFDQKELDALLGKAVPLTDEDAVPEPPAKPITKLGDVWLLGEHRVMCGDSTSAKDVANLMNGRKACLMQTDPPYGIAYVENAKSKGQSIAHVDIENDDLDGPKLQAFLEATIAAAMPHLEKKTAFYLWHPMLTQGTFFAAAAAAAAGILLSRQIIWVKPSMVFGRGDYHWQHELCFYGWLKGNKPPFYGPRNQTTIWNIGRETSKLHPTAKPVDLWRAPIKNHTNAGELMYEPFAGSGGQYIAAESEGRVCYGMELSPVYVDVIVNRWEQFTGKKATREKA